MARHLDVHMNSRPVQGALRRALDLRSAIGTRATIEYACNSDFSSYRSASAVLAKTAPWCLHPKGFRAPDPARFGSSDLDVFEQIFVEREFSELADVTEPRLIVDMRRVRRLFRDLPAPALPQCTSDRDRAGRGQLLAAAAQSRALPQPHDADQCGGLVVQHLVGHFEG
jgi:hypothetical protein